MYLGALRRGAPLGIFYALLLFALFPLMYMITLMTMNPAKENFQASEYLYGYAGIYSGVSAFAVAMSCVVIPIVFGVTIFSYLHNKRATDVYHALPMKRQTLFTANYLAGLTLIWVPLIISFATVAIAGAGFASILTWVYSPARIFTELLGWLVVASAVFTITATIAVLAGNSFDTVMFSLAFGGMYPVILFFAKMVIDSLLLGFTGRWSIGLMNELNMPALSPFTVMIYRLTMRIGNEGVSPLTFNTRFTVYTWATVAWAIITVALFFVANFLYARRKSELAGRTTSSSVLNSIVKYVITFVFGIIFGLLLSASFDSKMMFLVGAVIGGCIAYGAFEAIAARGFKTFPRAFIQMGISVGLTVAFVAVFLTGGLGYETRIPAAESVASVTINYNGRFGSRYLYSEDSMVKDYPYNSAEDMGRNVVLTSPEAIEIVRKLHADTVKEQRGRDEKHFNWEESSNIYPNIIYKLKNGKSVMRSYSAITMETAQVLGRLEDLEEFKRQTNPAFLLEAGQLKGVEFMNRFATGNTFEALSEAQQKQLLDALQKDALSERVEDIVNESYDAVGYIRLVVAGTFAEPTFVPTSSTILITEQYANTIAWLKSNGFYEKMEVDESKITRVGINRLNSKYMGYENDAVFIMMNPDAGMMDRYQVFDSEYAKEEWLAVDDAETAKKLYKLGRNSGASDRNGYQLYFEYGDSENALCLFVPQSKLPKELADRYSTLIGDELTYAKETAYLW